MILQLTNLVNSELKISGGNRLIDVPKGEWRAAADMLVAENAEQRGLEDYLYNNEKGPLDKIKPISDRNKNADTYRSAADSFLKKMGLR